MQHTDIAPSASAHATPAPWTEPPTPWDGPSVEPFKQAFRVLASGVAVITFEVEAGVHGFTATSLTSVSMQPPLALFCISRTARSHAHLMPGKPVGLSVLGSHQVAVARAFTGQRPLGGYADIGIAHMAGSPVVAGSCAAIAGAVERTYPAGDHTICLCALRAASTDAGTGPLLYFARDYHGHGPLP